MCDGRDLVMVAADEEYWNFFWHDSCQERPGGAVGVESGYHYEPRLGAAIPNGYSYDAAAGVVMGPPRTMTVVRTSAGSKDGAPGGSSIGPITQTAVVRVVDPGAAGSASGGAEAPYHPPDGTILETVTPPQTGWLRLGRSGLIHPTNTGNVAILLVGIDTQDHTTNVVLLLPGDSLDWYRIDGSATDIATCTTYPQDGGPRPGDVAELTHVVPVSPQL